MRFADIRWHSKELPTHGKQTPGRPKKIYTDQLMEDTGCTFEELPNAMNDRERWNKIKIK